MKLDKKIDINFKKADTYNNDGESNFCKILTSC